MAAPIRQLPVVPKLQQKALCQLFNGSLQGVEELLIRKLARRAFFFKSIGDQSFCNLIQRAIL